VAASSRALLALAGLDGLMAVAAGAFGAHGAHDPTVQTLLRTGAQYQATHAVAALAVLAPPQLAPRLASWAGWLFGVGALVFGASLYALAFSGVKLLGAITPLGGLMLMAGWAVVIWAGLSHRARI
jgi:uncharacterized membrane protein YgdD (TMEM256/DUF423 family)